jgi:hypothetical protein
VPRGAIDGTVAVAAWPVLADLGSTYARSATIAVSKVAAAPIQEIARASVFTTSILVRGLFNLR